MMYVKWNNIWLMFDLGMNVKEEIFSAGVPAQVF